MPVLVLGAGCRWCELAACFRDGPSCARGDRLGAGAGCWCCELGVPVLVLGAGAGAGYWSMVAARCVRVRFEAWVLVLLLQCVAVCAWEPAAG